MVEIGPNLAAFLMALIPSLAILAAAVAAFIHTRSVDAIRRTAQDTNERVSDIQSAMNGGNLREKKDGA